MPRKPTTHVHETTEETRHRILSAAHELFMDKGYRAVGTREVAEKCGISQPTLYYHFKNKDELYVAVALAILKRMKDALEQIAVQDSPSTQDKLVAAAIYLLRITRHDMNIASMLHDIAHELEVGSQNQIEEAFFASMVQPLMVILQQGIAQKVISAPTPESLSLISMVFLFLNMISTFSDQINELDRHKYDSHLSEKELAVRLVKFYLYGVSS
jgi:AcrR family transcriptional regulator